MSNSANGGGLKGAVLAIVATSATALMLAAYARVEPAYVIFGWIGFIPWLAMLDRTRTIGMACVLGVLLSELFVAALFPWIPRGISDYSGAPRLIAVVVTAAIAPLIQPQFIVSAMMRSVARRLGGSVLHAALVAACAYVATEWTIPKLFADTIGQGLYASPLLCQAADVGGTAGLTFVLLLVNDLLLAAVRVWMGRARVQPSHDGARSKSPGRLTPFGRARGKQRFAFPFGDAVRPLAAAVGIVLALAVYGHIRLVQLGASDNGVPAIRVAIIQANVSHYDRMAEGLGTFEAVRRILDSHFALSAQVLEREKLDLLIWPETVYPTSFGAPKSADGAGFDRAIGGFVAQSGVPLLFGTYERDGADEFNVAVLLEPSASGRVTFDSYRKTKLFPFTEYVPAWLDTAWLRTRWPWAGRWKAGSGPAVLTASLPGGRSLQLAPLICYDAIDPGFVLPAVRQGAEVLVTLSNDSWFAYPGVQRLILIVSAFRSIETRRPQLRATPTGISAAIDVTGALTDVVDVDQRGTLLATVAPAHGMTLMTRWGNWFAPAAMIGGVVLLIATAWQRNS